MFAGKTTALLEYLRAYDPACALVCKHAIDTRYDPDAVVSHDRRSCRAVRVHRADEILDLLEDRTRAVAVDEGHFFDSGLIPVVSTLTRSGRNVLVTALDRDSWGRPFPVVEALLRTADERRFPKAVCARCGKPAEWTQRLTPITDGCMVGGPESYEPRCRACWRPPPEPPPPMESLEPSTKPGTEPPFPSRRSD